MRLQNSNLNVAGSSSSSSSSSGQIGTNIIPQKRLFSPNNSACASVTHRPSVDLSACGSEFARSPDDAIRHGKVFFLGNYVLGNAKIVRNNPTSNKFLQIDGKISQFVYFIHIFMSFVHNCFLNFKLCLYFKQ